MNFNLDMNFPTNTSANSTNYDVIIIGGGPAGVTAAIYTARANLKTLIIDKGLTAGALGITGKIANYPGILEEISGADLLERMREQARSFGTTFVSDKVIGVDLQSEEKTVFANNNTYTARALIIATGSMGRGTRVRGEDEMLGRGVEVTYDAVLADIHARDARDTGRTDAPLRRAADALLLDNTTLDRDAGIMAAIAFVEDKVGKRG